MRAIWSGAIGFGLVNIPIKIYSATQGSDLDLDMLDKKDHSNIRFQRVNEKTGKEVAWENIVRGYNLDGRYIVLTESDFDSRPARALKIPAFSRVIETIRSCTFRPPHLAWATSEDFLTLDGVSEILTGALSNNINDLSNKP